MSFENKSVIITGAAQGIGLAMAAAFAEQRAHVVIADIDERNGMDAQRQFTAQGLCVTFMKTDVTQKTSVEQLVSRTVEQFGKLDIMVNNAGLAIIGQSENIPEEEWDLSINVMQKGVFFGCQEAGKVMIQQKEGVIINTSSINANVPFPMRLSYCAAKAAVSAMTKVLALEWAEHNIRVNAIAPGVTKTFLLEKAIDENKVNVDGYLRRIPMRRFAEPREIADSCLFLCSPQANYITGEILTVDGGWSVNGFI